MAPSPSEDELHRRFWDRGDRRQLFARDLRDPAGDFRFIAPGQADALRPVARAGYLICPVQGCPFPRFTTRGGSRRDHFVHLNGRAADHDGESFVHHAGKQLVAQWIRSTYPEAYLRVDAEKVGNGQLPDVLVVMPDGVRYAIEVQYSALTVAEWHLRHRGYVSQGIHDIWLLRHLLPHLRIGGREENRGRAQVGALHQAIHAAGGQLLWLNPFAEVVAAGTFRLRDYELLMSSSAAVFYGEVGLALDPLMSCRLERGRLRAPALDAAVARLELERAEERRREQERLDAARRQEDARRRREAAREQRQRVSREFSEEERQRWKESQNTRRRMEWESYERNAVLPRFGVVPWFIAEPLDSDEYVWGRTAAHWRARIFLDHIPGRVGKTFSFQSVSREFVLTA